MASSANKWCKKLMAKDKANKIKTFFGDDKRFGARMLVVDHRAESSFFSAYTPHKRLTSR